MPDETALPDLLGRVRAAIADPGAVVARDRGDDHQPAESITNWSARAVMAKVVDPMRAEIDRLTASPDPSTEPTARDLVDLWNRLTDTERLAAAARWLDDTRHAQAGYHRCLMGNHDARLSEVHSLRAERDSMIRDLAQAIYPGDPMPDRPLDTVWNHLLDQVRAATACVSGARPIPDDAAERPCPEKGVATETRTVLDCELPEGHDGWHRQGGSFWRKGAPEHVLADLGVTPTTDPAPAADGGDR